MFALIATLTGFAPAIATAQSASNLAPSTFQPENRRSTSGPVTVARDPGAAAPAGSEDLYVEIGDVRLEGALPQMAAANERFKQTLIGKRLAVARIFNATGQLETAYANEGFVLARVVLPQQTLRDGGTLRIVVVDGFIERIDSTKVPEPVRDRIVAMTNPLIGKRGIRLGEIERTLLLAGDTYGVRLASALSTGQSDGGTVLVLDGEYKRLTGSFGFDNLLADDIGPLNLNAGLEWNGALGLGETIYARIGGSPNRFFSSDPRYRILAAGAVFPIGLDGLTFNIEATSSQSTPDNPFLPTNSSFERLSLRLYYPWIRTRRVNLTSQFILDRLSDEQNLITPGGDIPIYRDEISALRATLDGSWLLENGNVVQGGAILTRGLDAFGAGGEPFSRQGAEAEFTKLVVNARYDAALDANWRLGLSGRVQSSFGDPLVTSEQMNVAGSGELSAFDAGSLRGDSGWTVRAELGHQSQVDFSGFPVSMRPYVYGAYSRLRLEQPTFFEQSQSKASSYGLGIEFLSVEESSYRNASVRMEFGRGERDDFGSEGNRFSIVASRRF